MRPVRHFFQTGVERASSLVCLENLAADSLVSKIEDSIPSQSFSLDNKKSPFPVLQN